MKGYYADVFAGFAPVGRRLLLQGAEVRIWELGLGPAGDICNKKNLKVLCHDIRGGRVIGCMLQPPCDTMSAIHNMYRRGALRSRARPWGADWVEHDAKLLPKVKAGNMCARAAAKIARLCIRCGVPFVEAAVLDGHCGEPTHSPLLCRPMYVWCAMAQEDWSSRWQHLS